MYFFKMKLSFFFFFQKNTILRAAHGGTFMPENLIWNIVIQVTAALRTIHNAGLSCWYYNIFVM